jgi:hypothetical protein
VVRHDRINTVFLEETCHPGVMRSLRPFVVEGVPPDFVLLPTTDLAACDLRDCHPLCATPAGIDQTFNCDRNTNHHLNRPSVLVDSLKSSAGPVYRVVAGYGRYPSDAIVLSRQALHERRFDTGLVELNYGEGPPNGPSLFTS